MNKENNIRHMTKLLQNNEELCPLLFDSQKRIYDLERKNLLDITSFLTNKIKGYINDVIVNDVVICGNIASYIYSEKTDIDIFALIKINSANIPPQEERKLCKIINGALQYQGVRCNLLNRIVDFNCINYLHAGSGTYSLQDNKWLSIPVHREFSYSIDDFYSAYCYYANDVENYVDELEKYNDSFLTMDSCQKLEKHLYQLRETALDAKVKNPEQEYCLEYNLYRCLKKFGVVAHFQNYISDSYNYNVNVLEQNI